MYVETASVSKTLADLLKNTHTHTEKKKTTYNNSIRVIFTTVLVNTVFCPGITS